MRLNITRIRNDDFGEYQCVSKNDINTTTAIFYVFGKLLFKLLLKKTKTGKVLFNIINRG